MNEITFTEEEKEALYKNMNDFSGIVSTYEIGTINVVPSSVLSLGAILFGVGQIIKFEQVNYLILVGISLIIASVILIIGFNRLVIERGNINLNKRLVLYMQIADIAFSNKIDGVYIVKTNDRVEYLKSLEELKIISENIKKSNMTVKINELSLSLISLGFGFILYTPFAGLSPSYLLEILVCLLWIVFSIMIGFRYELILNNFVPKDLD